MESIPIADGLELLVIPSTGGLFELHGWLVDRRARRVIAITTTPLDSDAVPEPRPDDDDNDQPYTPDRQYLDVQRLAPIHDASLTVVPFTAKEGDASGLFWLGYDGTHASLLLVATDAHEYWDCDILVRPSSAVSQTIVTSPFAAKLRVEGAAPQWSDLVATDIGEMPCSYDARVTWKNGFVIERSGEKKCAANARRSLTVHADGRVTATPLSPTP